MPMLLESGAWEHSCLVILEDDNSGDGALGVAIRARIKGGTTCSVGENDLKILLWLVSDAIDDFDL
eukprot:scaffold132746_cov31-Tisochrysis_lutea.AAC.3